MLQMIA